MKFKTVAVITAMVGIALGVMFFRVLLTEGAVVPQTEVVG